MRGFVVALALVVAGPALAQDDAPPEPGWLPLANDASCVVWDDAPADPPAHVTWTGGCINGRTSGTGTLTWRTESDGETSQYVCSGDMRNGRLHGKAKCAWPSGATYDGGWSNGSAHGFGVEHYKDGDVYEGQFWLGPRHGRGTYTFANGGRYEGEWRANRFDGQGTRFYANGARYEGGWRADKYHGRGTVHFASGASCSAAWADGAMTGPGEGLSDGKPVTCKYDTEKNRFSFGR